MLLNQWAKHSGKGWWLLGGILFWNVALGIFILMLKRGMLAHCVLLFLLANSVIVLAASRFLLHEGLSKEQWIGIFLGLIALALMEHGMSPGASPTEQ